MGMYFGMQFRIYWICNQEYNEWDVRIGGKTKPSSIHPNCFDENRENRYHSPGTTPTTFHIGLAQDMIIKFAICFGWITVYSSLVGYLKFSVNDWIHFDPAS